MDYWTIFVAEEWNDLAKEVSGEKELSTTKQEAKHLYDALATVCPEFAENKAIIKDYLRNCLELGFADISKLEILSRIQLNIINSRRQ